MKIIKQLFIFIGILMLPALSQAQDASQSYKVEMVITLIIIICAVALLILFVARRGKRSVMNANDGAEQDTGFLSARSGEEHMGFWGRLWSHMNYSGSIQDEVSVATEHEYDGIRELDNKLPPWWLYGFYFTIIFGIIYWIRFEVSESGPSQEEEYKAEMAKADADVQTYLASLGNLVDETNVELATDQADLDAGQAIYEKNCAVCHVVDGGGSVGPNFTDKFWLNGGDIKSIFSTIKYGVPAKGMIPWESQLSAEQIKQVSSYIYNLEGTTPANPKEPQGELFERSGSAAEGDASEESTTEERAKEEAS
ncbi:MAG: c-type cytochrome [Cytophagales bacterium]|nr:c-type cytochrome [Cytophagales bacterium]